ncbi:hypothetical protein D3C87_1785680 [compost metagenome]
MLRKVRRKAKPISPPKMTAFSAQVMTPRGLMTVEISPLMKAERVRSARRTILAICFLPFSVSP